MPALRSAPRLPAPLRGFQLHVPLLLKRFLECPLTAPLSLTRLSARSASFSAPLLWLPGTAVNAADLQ